MPLRKKSQSKKMWSKQGDGKDMPSLTIIREKRGGYSARKIQVYLDGGLISNIANGDSFTCQIETGTHEIAFAIGNTITTIMNVTPETDSSNVKILCFVESNGGISTNLIGTNIGHSTKERNTVGKTVNNAIVGTLAVIITLIIAFVVLSYVFRILIIF